MRSIIYIALAVVAAIPARVTAEARHSLAAIAAAVETHVAAGEAPDSEIRVGRLDPRLRLAPCAEPLLLRDTRGAQGGRPAAVEVRCEGSKPWALYVPVTVRRHAEVVVAARPIARGTTLAAADLVLARVEVATGAADLFSEPEQVVGRVAGRALAQGEALHARLLRAARLIRRGDQVWLASSGGAISVSVRGTALEDGAAGDRVTVRNLSSERVVEGIIRPDGVVHVQTGGG